MQNDLNIFCLVSKNGVYIWFCPISVCVCVFVFQYSAPCMLPRSSGALSLTDEPVRSEEGQSRQELI